MSLTDDELAIFRADVDDARRMEVTILHPRRLDDGAGSTKPDPAGPVRVGPIEATFSTGSGREAQTTDQIAQRGSYRLRLPIQTTIDETDQVEIGSRVYNVVWAPPITPTSLSRVVGIEEA